MATTIAVYRFATAPEIAIERGGLLEGWNPDAVSGDDYLGFRAGRLYDAIGAQTTDDEYLIGELPDGRWAIVGLALEDHPFAVEEHHRDWD